MASDDVPPDDMNLFSPTRDPLDAALRGESDDPAVAALVRDLRSAYLPEGTRARSEALAAFAGTGDEVLTGAGAASRRRPVEPAAEPAVPLGRRVAVGMAAFAATVTGKVVLGGAVAAAALGGLHASEVVDVPLLPRAPQAETAPSTVTEYPQVPDPIPALLGPPADPPTPDLDQERDRETPEPVVPAPPAPASDGTGPAPVAPADDASDRRPDPEAAPSAPAPTPGDAPAPDRPSPDEAPAQPSPGQPGEQPPAPGPQDQGPGPAAAEDPSGRPAGPADQPAPAPTGDEQRSSARP